MTKLQSIFLLLCCAGYFLACNTPSDEAANGKSAEAKATSMARTADYNEDKNAYFGDLHVHTSWSFDAFIYNVRTTPEDAYRFAKGEKINHVSGKEIQLHRPLDFMAVTDHAEYMGIMNLMIEESHPLSKTDFAKQINNPDRTASRQAFGVIGQSVARNQPIADLNKKDINQSTWKRLVETALKHNEPGKFTTFAAYEWTSSPIAQKTVSARNMHRNVIYKGDKVSDVPFTSFDSQNPEELWKWMDKERTKGIELLAIPHNANMSDGLMYSSKTFNGEPLDKAYAENRMRNEPVSEVSQIKGTSMTHPALSKNDEFADFEIYAYTFAVDNPPASQPKGSYVREAFKDGLQIAKEKGANPFKFGVIGSSDGHNSASPVEENNYFGKLGVMDGDAATRSREDGKFLLYKEMSAGGLAGVWAEENTRTAIYEALARKEVFATSGPRIKVRLFASWNFAADALADKGWVKNAYKNGVPMGSDLPTSTTAKAPSFIVQALKDAEGANLDRVQIVKGWLDANGKTQEKVFDVVWSDNRKMDAKGKLPPVGNTVNIADASYTNTIGAISLQAVWTDPEFDANQDAFYYARVLEIPTPRWSTFDAKELKIEPLKTIPSVIQERAWSSPIWYAQ